MVDRYSGYDMKIIFILPLLLAVFFSSCSRGGVRKDIPLGYKKDSLSYNCEVFRSNLSHAKKSRYTLTNTAFLTALSNEFAVYDLSRDRKLNDAIDGYLGLTNSFTNERGFLFERIGVCYFKLKDLGQAYKYIELSLFENADDSELYFYQSMLLTYYKKDPDRALTALKYVDLSRIDMNRQDYLAYQASVYTALKDYKKAFDFYQTAILTDPRRFYMNYDLTYFLQHAGFEKELSFYIRKSFSQLSEMKEKPFRVKAYRQMVLLNRLEKQETLEYRYHFSDGYEYYPSPLYYYDDPRPVERIKSYNLQIPLSERRNYATEKVFYPVFEDYLDLRGSSMILLTESMLDISNIQHPFLKESTMVPKIVGTNTELLLLSPTNIYLLVTNQDIPTNSKGYVVTNQSNVIYMKDLNFTYYADTEYFDMDKRGGWDFVFFGFNRNKEAVVTFYYPVKNEWRTLHYPLKKPDAEFVIQDLNNDGKYDLVLLDDDVYFLTNEKMP
jgi:hypothetical protein